MAAALITNQTTTVGEATTHTQPVYKVAKDMPGIRLLAFDRNYLTVRTVKVNGRTVGYEQLIRVRNTDFINFDGRPADFAFGLSPDCHDTRLHFTQESFGPGEPTRPVLVLEGWAALDADGVEAYKAVLAHEKQQRVNRQAAVKLEKQAAALRRR